MKYFITFCLVINLFFTYGQTSTYHPFPDSNVVWNFNFAHYCFWDGTANENYSITISGDTVINDMLYHKLITPFIESYSTGTCGGWLPTGYKGAIRQDIANRKVYFVPPDDISEQILYDYNMQIGDTVRGITQSYLPDNEDIVLAIDSVLVGNSYRKRWIINDWYNVHFIEGIGSTYGLIEPSPGYTTDFWNFELTCFQQNGETLFPEPNSDCQLITAITETNNYSTFVRIFPNPSHGTVEIEMKGKGIKILEIIDMKGVIIFQKMTEKTNITIQNLPEGIFIISIINEQNNKTSYKILNFP